MSNTVNMIKSTKLNKQHRDAMMKIFNNFMYDIVLGKEFINLGFEFVEDKDGGTLDIHIKRDRSFYRSLIARKVTYDRGRLIIDGSQANAAEE